MAVNQQIAVRRLPLPTILYITDVLGISAVVLVADRRGVTFGLLSRDPNDLANAPFHAGALSNAGVLLWAAAPASGLLGGSVLRATRSGRDGAR